MQLVKKTANVKLVIPDRIPSTGSDRNANLVKLFSVILAGIVLYPRKQSYLNR